ncbi:MAG: GatB/YqeY domain-containing protein [Nocardiopsaceae bacterium]|nr:GatB/YqeY domain-containing protein [Nocardiopsaceae bacterium]
MGTDTDTLQARLRLALRAAMKSKDAVATSALRSALAAIGNAEAVSRNPDTANAVSQHVAGGAAGLGAAEAERRSLTRDETARIVRDEISDRQASARQYEAAGHPDRAERLRYEAQAIQSAIDHPGLRSVEARHNTTYLSHNAHHHAQSVTSMAGAATGRCNSTAPIPERW